MAKRRALGVDISHWQGEVNFSMTKRAGASFVIIKACQNLWPDDQFARSWENAKKANLLRGAYHFLICEMAQLPLKNKPDILPIY